MPERRVRIRLDQRACDLGRQPRRAAAPALHPEAPAILARAIPDPSVSGICVVTCTRDEAEALLDHFGALRETLVGLGGPGAAVCGAAADSIRRALVTAEAKS